MASISNEQLQAWASKAQIESSQDMARLASIESQPLTAEERAEILGRKSDATHVRLAVEEVAVRFAASGHKIVGTDIDGTVSRYTQDNTAVAVDSVAQKGLKELTKIDGLQVFAASGGDLSRGRGIFDRAGLEGADVFGSNGVQQSINQPDGTRISLDHPDMVFAMTKVEEAAEYVRTKLQTRLGAEEKIVASGPEASLVAKQSSSVYEEIKGGLWAFHYATAGAETTGVVLDVGKDSAVQAHVKAIDPKLTLEVRSGNIEVTWSFGRDKGSVQSEQMATASAGLFLYDDTNDFPAVKVQNDIRDNAADARYARAWAVYNPPGTLWPESPDEVLLRADVIFADPSALGKGLSALATRIVEINPERSSQAPGHSR